MSTSGRPPILDAAKQREVAAIIAVGCTRKLAAAYVGCARSTIARTAARDREFRRRLRRADAAAEVGYLKRIRLAARKEQYWRAAAWALERMHPGRYAPRPAATIAAEEVERLLAGFAEIVAAQIENREDRRRILKPLRAMARRLGRASS